MPPKKPTAAQVLSQALVTGLQQAKSAGGPGYPAILQDLAAHAGLKATGVTLRGALTLAPFGSRAVAAATDPAAPAALHVDLATLTTSPQLLDFALAKACKKTFLCRLDQLAAKAKLNPALAAAFTDAVTRQVESGTLPDLARSTTVKGVVHLYLARRPPPRKPEEELAEKLLKVLTGLRPLGPESYPVTVARLAELTDPQADPRLVDKALGHALFTADAVVTQAKNRQALVAAREDNDRLLTSPVLLRGLLAAAGATEHNAVALTDVGKSLPKPLQKPFAETLARAFDAGNLPQDVGWLTFKKAKLLYRQAAAAPPPPSPPFSAPPAVPCEQALDEAFGRLNRERGSHNLVSLLDLRRAVPAPRAEFDGALDRLRRAGKYTLSAAEGRHGLSPEEREAALVEDGALLLYVSRRLP